MAVEELNGSELGTLSYWESAYETEIENFKRTGDLGEVWFGEDSLLRVIRYLTAEESVKPTDRIVDIGCGNGVTLLELAREGYENLLGIDYSRSAVELASEICQREFPRSRIGFRVCDLIEGDISEYAGKFKVAHDKGTYDAVSLHPLHSRTMRETYVRRVGEILSEDGLFIITSCNWTEGELTGHFSEYFTLNRVIPTPQFRFGGVMGNVVTSLVLVKKKD